MTTHKTECTYCQLVVDAPTSEHEQPPELTDDVAWEALAEQHAPTCEWILTRAHRFDAVR